MTIPSESFKLVTPSMAVNLYLVDYALQDESIVNPNATNALLLGEWLSNVLYQDKAARDDAGGGHLSFPFFSPKGAYDVQAQKIVPLIVHGSFVADTWVFDRATVTAMGQELISKLIAFEGANRSILTLTGGGGAITRAIVLRTASSSTAPIRILGNY